MRSIRRTKACFLCSRKFKKYEHMRMHVRDKHKTFIGGLVLDALEDIIERGGH